MVREWAFLVNRRRERPLRRELLRAPGPDDRAAGEARRHNAISLVLTLAVLFAFIVRVLVNDEMMNHLVEYTSEGGAFYEKLHFGTYAILLLLPVALFSRPIYLEGNDIRRFRDLVRFSLILIALIVLLILIRRVSAGGLLVDTYLVAGAAGLIMLALPRDGRRLHRRCAAAAEPGWRHVGILEFGDADPLPAQSAGRADLPPQRARRPPAQSRHDPRRLARLRAADHVEAVGQGVGDAAVPRRYGAAGVRFSLGARGARSAGDWCCSCPGACRPRPNARPSSACWCWW